MVTPRFITTHASKDSAMQQQQRAAGTRLSLLLSSAVL